MKDPTTEAAHNGTTDSAEREAKIQRKDGDAGGTEKYA
jgi:hypothetical protein